MTRLSRQPEATLPNGSALPLLSRRMGTAQPCSLYQGQEFLFLVSSWFGSPETLINLSFTFRTTANTRNKKAKELKINGDYSLQTKRKHLFCITHKEAKSSYTVQSRASCLGCQEHTVPLAVRHRELSICMLKLDGAFFSPAESKTYPQFRRALALSQEGSRKS